MCCYFLRIDLFGWVTWVGEPTLLRFSFETNPNGAVPNGGCFLNRRQTIANTAPAESEERGRADRQHSQSLQDIVYIHALLTFANIGLNCIQGMLCPEFHPSGNALASLGLRQKISMRYVADHPTCGKVSPPKVTKLQPRRCHETKRARTQRHHLMNRTQKGPCKIVVLFFFYGMAIRVH